MCFLVTCGLQFGGFNAFYLGTLQFWPIQRMSFIQVVSKFVVTGI